MNHLFLRNSLSFQFPQIFNLHRSPAHTTLQQCEYVLRLACKKIAFKVFLTDCRCYDVVASRVCTTIEVRLRSHTIITQFK